MSLQLHLFDVSAFCGPAFANDVVTSSCTVRRRPAAARRRPGRPIHKRRHPVHITLRLRKGLVQARSPVIHELVKGVIRDQRDRSYAATFQIVHFSIQRDHIHLIVEAADGPTLDPATRRRNSLKSGVSGFKVAFAKRLNRLMCRKGAVWSERYHREDLETPRQVRNALRYVLLNYRKHGIRTYGHGAFDVFSSAFNFDGWREAPSRAWSFADPDSFVSPPPRTWLLAKGWRIHGPIEISDTPGPRQKLAA